MEGRNLFDPMDHEHRQYVYPLAMAQYIAYLGPPSPKLMGKSPILSKYFDGDGIPSPVCVVLNGMVTYTGKQGST